MAPKVQGTRNDSIHRVPPSFLSAKTLQHCKHTGLNQAYFTRSLIINTFFASLPGINFIRKKARVCGSIASLLYAVCLYRAYGRWTLSLHIYIMNSWLYTISFLHKVIDRKPTFKQRIAMLMHMLTHGWQTMVTETSKTTNFEPLSFITFSYC